MELKYTHNVKDLTGQRFGRLLVIERAGSRGTRSLWRCACDCGNETLVICNSLVRGRTKSCGCFDRERKRTHGMTHSKLYDVWRSMRKRCNNSRSPNYHNYGGRGITICAEWSLFLNFYNWAMTNGYTENLSLDRIDNNGGYSPENCKWSDCKEQNNNRRNNVWYAFDGQIKNIQQWSEFTGMSYQTLYSRIQSGWSIEKTITTPARKKNKPSCRERGAAYGK